MKTAPIYSDSIDLAKPALPKEGFIRLPQILSLIPVGRSTWWARVKSGEYPQPVKLSERTTAWRAADIHALIQRFENGEV